MFTEKEKELIITVLVRFLMKETATYEEFEMIKNIVNKLEEK